MKVNDNANVCNLFIKYIDINVKVVMAINDK